jgi:hypothetical protein
MRDRDIYSRAANWDMVTTVRDNAYNLLTKSAWLWMPSGRPLSRGIKDS